MTVYTYSGDNSSIILSNNSSSKKISSYNKSSEFLFRQEDIGLLSQQYSETIDWGFVYEPAIVENYGFMSGPGSTESLYPFGSISISGSSITQEVQVDFDFYGSAEVSFSSSINTQATTITESGEKIESKTLSYNESSVKLFVEVDNGFVNNPSTEIYDYGFIYEQPTIEDYGFMSGLGSTESLYPFGSVTLLGSAVTQEVQVDFNVYGSAEVSFSVGNYKSQGSIVESGQKIESKSVSYNESSIIFYTESDYGNITVSTNSVINYGLLAGPIDGKEDYENLTSSTQSLYPFGSITLLGSATYRESQVDYGISGKAEVTFTANLSSSGTLFAFGDKLESRTYDYNEESLFDSDYGNITSSHDLSENYGLIINSVTTRDDYGSVTEQAANIGLVTPFGSIFISGNGQTSEEFNYEYNSSGSVNLSGQSTNTYSSSALTSTTLFQIFGSSTLTETESYLSVGTITAQGEKIESFSFDYNEDSIRFTELDDYGSVSIANTSSLDYGSIASEVNNGIENLGLIKDLRKVGTVYPFGTITVSGSSLDSLIVNSEENTQLFVINGFAQESFVANSPENTQLLTISGISTESRLSDYVGIGTLTIIGSSIDSEGDSYQSSGTINISGTAQESFVANTPENTQLFVISGISSESRTSNYLGIGNISLSGVSALSETDSYVGSGSKTIFGSAQESFVANPLENTQLFVISGFIEESETESYVGTGSVSIDISSRNYSPIYPGNSGDPGAGIGTITLYDSGFTRAAIPYIARGQITVSGIVSESFGKQIIGIGGTVNINGNASTTDINVYTYSGQEVINLNGFITERTTDSYFGLGNIFLTPESNRRKTKSYNGTGTINVVSSSFESFSAQTPEETQTYNISGNGTESFTAQPTETEVLYTIDISSSERRTFGYQGDGTISINGSAISAIVPRIITSGGFRFATYTTNDIYDTCDSTLITCDFQDSAFVSFVANPPENTQLFNIFGSAITREFNFYQYVGIGIVTLSSQPVPISKSSSEIGTGTLFAFVSSKSSETNSYVGLGTILTLSGSSDSKTSSPISNTVLVQIGGKSDYRIVNSYSGIGTGYINGQSDTQKLSSYTKIGNGQISLSGELLYPNVQFIPKPKGFGTIFVSGQSAESVGYRDILSGSKTIFTFSSGKESFTKTNYAGIGTIYINDSQSIFINNPYQPPRTYVVII